MSKLRILELEAQVERKDKYILELEGDTKCVALCVHKRALDKIAKKNELLYSAERELCHLIAIVNKQLKDGIRSTDADEPEYYDGQTISDIRDNLHF